MIVAQEDPLVAALHACHDHDRLRAAELERIAPAASSWALLVEGER
jgi:hypothetical protein